MRLSQPVDHRREFEIGASALEKLESVDSGGDDLESLTVKDKVYLQTKSDPSLDRLDDQI